MPRKQAKKISNLDALNLLRLRLDPTRAACNADWDRVASLVNRNRGTEPPAGAFTVYEYMERFGVMKGLSDLDLERAVAEGKLETGIFYNKAKMRSTRFWWLPAGDVQRDSPRPIKKQPKDRV